MMTGLMAEGEIFTVYYTLNDNAEMVVSDIENTIGKVVALV